MKRLGALDAGFVYAESATWPMNVGALMELDPSSCPAAFGVDRLAELLAARLAHLGPFRHRLRLVPLGLDRPLWVDDENLDLGAHLHRATVPSPGGRREVAEAIGQILGGPLDRSRPLWEIWLLEGLAGEHAALLVKAHHSLFDGVAATRLFEVLCDLSSDAPFDRDRGPVTDEYLAAPSDLELLARAGGSLAGLPLRTAATALRLTRSGIGITRLRRTETAPSSPLPFQAPRTSLNHALSGQRGFAYCDLPLSELQAVKDAAGVKFNDVVLAVCAGGLRRYLTERGELPDRPLVAQVPVAMRTGGGHTEGNAVSVIGASLATEITDPLERLQRIAGSTRGAKQMHNILGQDVVLRLAALLPPVLLGAAVRAYTRLRLAELHPPIFNLIVSNMIGSRNVLYTAGARIVAIYPIGPLLDGGGLNITAMSYTDLLGLGFVYCPDLVPDPWALVDATRDAGVELRDAALSRHGAAQTAER